MAARTSVGFSMAGAEKLVKQLEALAIEVREKVGQQALTAGMVPVQTAVRSNSPESSNTRSREKQSSKTKKKWSGSKKLKDTIRSVVRTRRKAGITAGLIGLVGPSYSEGGGHGNLFSRDHKRKVLWGRDAGSTRSVNQFVKRAADESSGQAEAAVVSALKTGIDQAAARSTNG